jgi:hypothetical protein
MDAVNVYDKIFYVFNTPAMSITIGAVEVAG